MAKRIVNNHAFRDAFTFVSKDVTQWFPGHMHKGMRQMQNKLKSVDCIIEVHDARIPFSGRNPNFENQLMIRPHMLILNKTDLADLSKQDEIVSRLESEGIKKVLYTDCKEDKMGVLKRKIIPTIKEIVSNSPRFNREEAKDYNLLVIGVPNVGKSSFINSMRGIHLKKSKATRVGSIAGITRGVLEKIKVAEHPSMYLLDTPGILAPNVRNVEVGMKLALCSTLQDHLVGHDVICDYMLYYLNKNDIFSYVDYFQLDAATDDILNFLGQIAVRQNFSMKVKSMKGGLVVRPDIIRAAEYALQAFRLGKLGRIMLDADYLKSDRRKS